MPNTVRKFVDPNKVGTHRPADSNGTRVYTGMKDADWKCNSCNSGKELPATLKVCPDCNNPKDKSEGYHSPSSPRPYLTQSDMNERGIDLERQKDEECPFCQSRIKSKSEICPNCGGNIKDVYKAERICPNCQRETNTKKCSSCGTETVSKKSQSSSSTPTSKLPKLTEPSQKPAILSKSLTNSLFFSGIGLVVLLCITAIVIVFRSHEETGTVAANNWTCSVPLVGFQYDFHSDWTLPEGADLVQSYEKFHHNKQVEAGLKEVCEKKWEVVGSHQVPKTKRVCTKGAYIETEERCDEETNVCTYHDIYEPDSCEDVPDGTETIEDKDWVEHCEDKMQYKDVPVNQTYYEYNIWEWASINPITSSGNDNVIACPVVIETETLRQNGIPTTTCQTSFSVGEDTYPYSPDCQNQFPAFSKGSQWMVTISGPSITDVNPLR